jgi:hypothetical protein
MRQVLKEKGQRHAALTRGFCLPYLSERRACPAVDLERSAGTNSAGAVGLRATSCGLCSTARFCRWRSAGAATFALALRCRADFRAAVPPMPPGVNLGTHADISSAAFGPPGAAPRPNPHASLTAIL